MRIVGLLIAFALLAVGVYRAFLARRPQAGPGTPAPPPTPVPSGGGADRHAPVAGASSSRAGEAPTTTASATPASTRTPAPPPAKAEPQRAAPLPALHEYDSDEDITIITLAPSPQTMAAMHAVAKASAPSVPATEAQVREIRPTPTASGPGPQAAPRPRPEAPAASAPIPSAALVGVDDDEDLGEAPSAVPIVYDEDAAVDEPTRVNALILVSAASQTDQGRRRRRNEDSMLVLDEHHLYVVADGMGGHAGGDVASKLAVETIAQAFETNSFVGEPYPDVPRRGSELALAIQMANKAIHDHARANAAYQGMGTTVVGARFSPNKQRLYVGHVGDSRCYRLRGKALTQITTDHTMGAQGVTGPLAAHLNRAVGVSAGVKIDLIIARPRPEDVYVLCTDGLTKMVPDADIQQILLDEPDLGKAVQRLVERANARGGRDNITVVLVQVKDPKGLARYIQQVAKGRERT